MKILEALARLGNATVMQRPDLMSSRASTSFAGALPRFARFGLSVALASAAFLSRARDAPAQEQSPVRPSVAALPGSPRPSGLGLAPESPNTSTAAVGRAPSFGAPTKKDAWAFNLGGSVFAWEAVGFGRVPATPAPNQISSPILHVPALVEGRQPYWSTTGGSLFIQYGNSVVSATVNATFNATGKERQSYYNPTNGPAIGQAFLTINPLPIGQLQLSLRIGAFTESFAGPGQWGWGLFGPMLATRGYGFAATAQYPYNDQLLTTFEVGLQGVPGVPEDFVRGEYTGWLETGISSLVAHAHAGFIYKNQYTVRLHAARAYGFDERQYLVQEPRDGKMDAYLLETRYMASPFGQLGVTAAFWNFDDANRVHDGIWWGLGWTKGGSSMLNDYVGIGGVPTGFCNPIADANGVVTGEPFPCTGDLMTDGSPVLAPNGDGKLFAISAEYDTSLASLLWHPRPFNGTAPDIRVALAATAHFTLATGDPAFDGASGFSLAAQLEYQMLSWLSLPVRFFGDDRDFQYGRYRIYSISPGIAFRRDWQSTDRIELIYTRRFYNADVDDNPARPLDRDVLALGAYINF
jgi:hypothetical protein